MTDRYAYTSYLLRIRRPAEGETPAGDAQAESGSDAKE